LTAPLSRYQTDGCPTKIGFKLAPFSRLQQMGVRLISKELLPFRE
jgi:hypothetical protein